MKVWGCILLVCLGWACKKDLPLNECMDTTERILEPVFTVPMVLPTGQASDSLDVDGDGIADLRFQTWRSYADIPGAHEDYFNHSIWAVGIAGTRVTAPPYDPLVSGPCVLMLACGDLVGPDGIVPEQSALESCAWGYYACNDFASGGYFGFVQNKGGLEYCGYVYAVASALDGVRVIRVVLANCDGLPVRVTST